MLVPSSVPRALALSVVVLGMALAGCLGGEDPVPTVEDPLPAGCADATLATIDDAGQLSPSNLTLQQPFKLCVTNEGNATFTYVGMKNKLPKPDFVPLPSVVDPHAEHRGGLPPVIPEFTVEAGQTVVIDDIDFAGLVMIMEPTNMNNFVVWEVVPEAEQSWAVVVNQVVLTGSAAGDTDAGQTDTYTFDISVPDLAKVQVALKWADGADDSVIGAAANRDDEFEVRLKDPSGTVVASKTQEERDGDLKVEFSLDIAEFPETVSAETIGNASAALAAVRPPDASAAGTWTVEIELLQAPGAAPDSDGTTKDAPTGDGHQEWTATVTVVHRWASVDVLGLESAVDIVKADL